MEYYQFMPWCDEKDLLITRYELNKQLEDQLYLGLPSANKIKSIQVYCKLLEGVKNDFLVCSMSLIHAVSERLKDYLSHLENDTKYLEFIPIEFLPKIKEKYFHLNIMNDIDAIDKKKSEYTVFPDFMGVNAGKINSINKLYLNENIIKKRNIFCLVEYRPYIYISESLMKNFNSNNFTGFKTEIIR